MDAGATSDHPVQADALGRVWIWRWWTGRVLLLQRQAPLQGPSGSTRHACCEGRKISDPLWSCLHRQLWPGPGPGPGHPNRHRQCRSSLKEQQGNGLCEPGMTCFTGKAEGYLYEDAGKDSEWLHSMTEINGYEEYSGLNIGLLAALKSIKSSRGILTNQERITLFVWKEVSGCSGYSAPHIHFANSMPRLFRSTPPIKQETLVLAVLALELLHKVNVFG